jgi:hypothetical protein
MSENFNTNNKINQPKFVRNIVDLDSIQPEHLGSLKYLATFKEPVSILFWNRYANYGEDNLLNLVSEYKLITLEDKKICPIEIPGVDLKPFHAALAKDLLNRWKNK